MIHYERKDMILACFTILSYRAVDSTIKCINSLLKLVHISDCKIIVYDNASPDDSYKMLCEKYKHKSNIILQRNDINEGFSVGTNKAYSIAKSYNPKYIIALNNDVIISQRDFLDLLNNNYESSHAYIIGPDVYSPVRNIHQSPLYDHMVSHNEIDCEIKKCENILQNIDHYYLFRLRKYYSHKIIRHMNYSLIEYIRKVCGRPTHDLYKYDDYKYPVISGSCIIATKPFIDAEDKLLTPETKFYGEEILLTYRCIKLNYKIRYCGELHIIHYHGVSSGRAGKPSKQQIIDENKKLIEAYNFVNKII